MKNMKNHKHKHLGATLIELVFGFLIAAITVLCVCGFLADNHRSYQQTYAQAFSGIAEDELALKAIFNKTIRKASYASGASSVDSDGDWLEVQYYSSSSASDPDRYALFYTSNETLFLEKGDLETRQTLSTETICENIQNAEFVLNGTSAQLFLDLDDTTKARRINLSAVMRNP